MSGTTFCDHCGMPQLTIKMYHHEHVPVDVDSANAGESASLCELCQHELITSKEEE